MAQIVNHTYPAAGNYAIKVIDSALQSTSIGVTVVGTAPVLASIAPTTAVAGAADLTMTCTGTFDGDQVIYVDGKPQSTAYGGNPLTTCTTVVKPSQFSASDTASVWVQNADGGRSVTRAFTFT